MESKSATTSRPDRGWEPARSRGPGQAWTCHPPHSTPAQPGVPGSLLNCDLIPVFNYHRLENLHSGDLYL